MSKLYPILDLKGQTVLITGPYLQTPLVHVLSGKEPQDTPAKQYRAWQHCASQYEYPGNCFAVNVQFSRFAFNCSP